MMDDAERAARRAALLAEFGSEAAILQLTLRERELHSAAALLTVMGGPGGHPSLMGWTGGRAANMPPEVRREIGGAVRLPQTVNGTLNELLEWRRRMEALTMFQGDADPPLWLKARCAILEQRMDTLPPQSRTDIVARLRWIVETMTDGPEPDPDEASRLARLRVDLKECATAGLLLVSEEPEPPLPIEADLGAVQIGHPAHPSTPDVHRPRFKRISRAPAAAPLPRTLAERRQDVVDLLGSDLSDREIARRVGCSPQTVGNVRKALA